MAASPKTRAVRPPQEPGTVVAAVAQINVTPVKGLALRQPAAVELDGAGARENRRFYLIAGGRLYNGMRHGPLVAVSAACSGRELALRFPDGAEVAGEVTLGRPVETDFWGRPVAGRVVEGPWAAALSAYCGAEVELVRSDQPGAASDVAVGTLVARASCERLAEELGAPVDPRRFRMLLELDGPAAHAEDGWRGRRLRVGGAVLTVGGPVPRCAITTQDPASGVPTLDTLRAIRRYRGLRDGRFADFGVYFEVARPGRVALADPVVLLDGAG